MLRVEKLPDACSRSGNLLSSVLSLLSDNDCKTFFIIISPRIVTRPCGPHSSALEERAEQGSFLMSVKYPRAAFSVESSKGETWLSSSELSDRPTVKVNTGRVETAPGRGEEGEEAEAIFGRAERNFA